MKMFTCPHCKRSSISIGQRLFVGMNPFSECPQCHSRLSISFASRLFTASPLFAWALLNLYNVIPAHSQWLVFGVVALLTLAIGLMVPMIVAGGNKGNGLRSKASPGKVADTESR
jgi:hypothetical protein